MGYDAVGWSIIQFSFGKGGSLVLFGRNDVIAFVANKNLVFYRNTKIRCVKQLQSLFNFFCHIDIFRPMYYYH